MSRLMIALIALLAMSCAAVTEDPPGGVATLRVDASFPPEYVDAIIAAQAEWSSCLDQEWHVEIVITDAADADIRNAWEPGRERGRVLATTRHSPRVIYMPADLEPHYVRTVALHELGHFWGIRGEAEEGAMARYIRWAAPTVWESDCRALRYWMLGEGDDPVTDGEEI